MPFAWIITDPSGRPVERTNHRKANHAKQFFMHAMMPNRVPPPHLDVDKLIGNGVEELWSQFEAKGFAAKRFRLVDAITDFIEVDTKEVQNVERIAETNGRAPEAGSSDCGSGSAPEAGSSDQHRDDAG
jgi:hypothetical protein